MVGVTPTCPHLYQIATRRRTSLTSLFSSIRSWVHSVSKWSWFDPFFFGLAIGTKLEPVHRPWSIWFVMLLVGKTKMARRLVERRVDNRVFDDDLAQPGPYDPEILLLRLNFQELLDHRLKWVFARRLNRAVMTISFWRKEYSREQRKRTHLTCIARKISRDLRAMQAALRSQELANISGLPAPVIPNDTPC